MIILAGSIRIPPDNIERAASHLEAIVNATRSELGCISYSFAHDVIDEGLIRIFEVFANEKALAAHRASPHMAVWRGVQPELGVCERNLTQYETSRSEKT